MRYGDQIGDATARFLENLSFTLNHYESALGQNNFFGGNQPLMGDFGLFHAFDMCLVTHHICFMSIFNVLIHTDILSRN
jgi:hypothetical protein